MPAPIRPHTHATALAGCALLAVTTLAAPTARAGAPPPDARRAIAITYFDNHSADTALAPLSRGLADMLITDLSAVGTLRIVERSRLNQVLDELTLSKSPFIDPKSAQRLGRGLAAEFILTGGVLVSGDTLRVDARLIRVATGEVAAGQKVEGPRAEFFAIEKELVDLIVHGLNLELSFPERSALRRNATQSWEAWLAYSQGLLALDAGDRDRALELFREALEADPRYQAAKDATSRLRVLITRDSETREKLVDDIVKRLDPKAANFPAELDRVFTALGADGRALAKRLALLSWLIEHDLRPWNVSYSRVALELTILASQVLADPDLRPLVPGVCEYAMTWYPDQPGLGTQCKGLLQAVERLAAADQEVLRTHWKAQLATADSEWMLALRDNYDRLRALLVLAGRKAQERPPAATPPAPDADPAY